MNNQRIMASLFPFLPQAKQPVVDPRLAAAASESIVPTQQSVMPVQMPQGGLLPQGAPHIENIDVPVADPRGNWSTGQYAEANPFEQAFQQAMSAQSNVLEADPMANHGITPDQIPNFAAQVAAATKQPSAVEQAQNEYNAIESQARNPVNKNKGAKGLISEIIENFLYSMGQGNSTNWKERLLQGAAGAGIGFWKKGWNEQRQAEAQLPYAQWKVDRAQKNEDRDVANNYKQAQQENLTRDDARREKEFADTAEWRRSETARKIGDTEARQRTSRMTTVAGMLKNLPEFVPGDPKYKELEAALGDVGLPVTQKDAKKKVDLKQDQRTGEWTTILTDPVNGKQEVRPVMKDGKVFASTPTVVMQGEYGMLKQNDQQVHSDQQLQTRLAAADETQKRSLLVTSLDKWKEKNRHAEPDEIAAAEARIRATIYGNQ